jgi:1,4-alpha-glucan branching enzyme
MAPKPTIEIETTADRVVCRWPRDKFKNFNPIDEEILLKIFRDQDLVCEHKVEHLTQKEIHLDRGDYRLELSRYFKPEVQIRSPLARTPAVAWLSDSPVSHIITWQGLDWDDVRREVEHIHRLNWDSGAAVALRVLTADAEGKLKNDWLPVPFKDHAICHGRLEEVELAVVTPDENSVLKSLFLAKPCPRQPLQVYANEAFSVLEPAATVRLSREISETDTLQAHATWAHLGPGKFFLELLKDEQVVYSEKEVAGFGDWFFPRLESGRYRVRLTSKGKGETKIFDSAAITLPHLETRCRLMPISENRAFCYWHVSESIWEELSKEFGELTDRVTCFLQIAFRRGDTMVPVPELTRLVDVGSTPDYYLDLAPDLVYHARLSARIDGHGRPLTEWSNPCQLARTHAGRAPIEHKKEYQPTDHPTARPLRGPTGTAHHSWGYLMLHLHAHLPYIADPINFGEGSGTAWSPIGYPQEWYPEAVCDTYLPLLGTFEQLISENVDFKVSLDISPPLVAMMKSQRHASDVLSFLERLIQKAQLEVERTGREEPHFTAAALMHLSRYRRCRELFLGYGGNLVSGFRRLQDSGHLELSTCVGTHPMLPLWTSEPSAIRGHVLAAAQSHEAAFGRPAEGIWLPECSYTPGIEPYLEEAGLRYIFGEAHCITRGDSPAEFDVNAPVYAKGSRICVFPRDPETGKQVWSGDEGYPGDPDYLEFHIRGGPFKYNRITDRRGGHKQPYNPDWADNKASMHAGHFLDCRNARFSFLRHNMWKKPLIVAPYDAELFGHHWYEGPRFLYYLFKKLHFDQSQTELTTPSAYLASNPTCQDMFCNVSSWGHEGTFVKWMYGDTSWMYRHGHEAARALDQSVKSGIDSELQKRVLAQAARHLMVASSSDLPFVISNGHFVDRMKDQFCGNLRSFYDLCEDFQRLKAGGDIDHHRLRSLELEVNLMPDLDPRWFSGG